MGLLVVAGAWAIPVYLRDGGRYLRQVIFQPDLQVGEMKWDSFHRYFRGTLVLTLPLLLFLPLAVRDWWRRGYSPLLAFALVVIVIFGLIPKKRPHYLLPMYPFLALGIAAAITREAREKRWLRHAATIAIGMSVAGGPLYYGVFQRFVEPPEDPDLQMARQFVADIVPNSRVYALPINDLEETLAWIGHRKIRVIAVDGDVATALATLQNAPAGSYLVTMAEGLKTVQSAGFARPLRLLDEGRHPKYKVFLYRFGGPTD